MRQSISVILACIMTMSVFNVSADSEVYGAEKISFDSNYGTQIISEQNEYAVTIYNQLVSQYVYQEGESGNEDGTYTGLAQAISSADSIKMRFTGISTNVSPENKREEANAFATLEGDKMLKSAIDAFDAFAKDYPQVYWMKGMGVAANVGASTVTLSGVVTCTLTISVTLTPTVYFSNAYKYVQLFNDGIIDAQSKMEDMCDWQDDDNTEEKVSRIHDYIASVVDYDYDAAKNGSTDYCAHTPLAVFVDNASVGDSVVCEGYAKAFKILCDRYGIENALLSGDAVNLSGVFEKHMWNAVKMPDEQWYSVDVTWDDQGEVVYRNYLLAGQNSAGFFDYYKNDHLACGVFSNNANAKEFDIPQIAEERYGYDGTVEIPLMPDKENDEENTTAADKSNDKAAENNSGSANAKSEQETIKVVVGGIKDKVYTGRAITQKVIITKGELTLKEGRDYKISYTNNVNAGKATCTIIFTGKYSGKIEKKFAIKKASISKATSKKIKKQKLKTRKRVEPKATIKFLGKKLKEGRDYTVTYKNNKKKGTAKIIVKGKRNFKGKKVIKFKIK